jgi:hypothetical protein
MATTAAPPAAGTSTTSNKTGIRLPPASLLSPVPADIDIAQAATPLHISEVAAMLDLKPEEVDLYGQHQAKVRE